MYRRGVADAEQGEPQPFFYQHYYHYRRGYDRARRRRLGLLGDPRRLALRAALAALALAGAGYGASVISRRPPQPAPAAATAPLTPSPTATAVPSRTPIFPTATPIPTATPVALRVGGSARVIALQGSVLRGRESPSRAARETARFREGDVVRLLEGPVEADGYTWWRVEGEAGAGWSAQGSLEGVMWLAPIVDS